MIKAVIFDMFETLVTLFRGKTYFSEDIAADLGIGMNDFRREWHVTEKDRSTGKYTIEEGLAITLKQLGVYSEDKVQLAAEHRKQALTDTFTAIPEETVNLLRDLRKAGKKTGLITNTFSDERDFIRASELYPLFDAALISYEQFIWELSEYAVKQYIASVFPDRKLNPEDREMIIRYYKCECFGIVTDWLENGMNEDAIRYFRRIFELKKDQAEELIRRCEESG